MHLVCPMAVETKSNKESRVTVSMLIIEHTDNIYFSCLKFLPQGCMGSASKTYNLWKQKRLLHSAHNNMN